MLVPIQEGNEELSDPVVLKAYDNCFASTVNLSKTEMQKNISPYSPARMKKTQKMKRT